MIDRTMDPRTGAAAPERLDASSVLQDAVRRLREEILARHQPGAALGSEEELQNRLGVSRPTLRQAARVLEHENLLTVRRGSHGGLFTREPAPDAVSRVAAVYLRYQRTTHHDLHRADSLIVPEIARLAALHTPAADRATLAEFAASAEHRAKARSAEHVRAAWREFGLQLITLVDNPPLALFYEMMLDLSDEPFRLQGVHEPALRQRMIRFHVELSTAIRAGMASQAAEIASAYLAETLTWIN